jgi:uncharacterized glyoxalase superfamily protein PhnB
MPSSPVIPVLAYDDVAEAADWLCRTFGFAERWRAGSHRAQLSIGADGTVALTGGRTERSGRHWTFSESIADVAAEEWGGTSGPALQ